MPVDTTEPVLETTIGSVIHKASADYPQQTGLVAGDPPGGDYRRWTFTEMHVRGIVDRTVHRETSQETGPSFEVNRTR